MRNVLIIAPGFGPYNNDAAVRVRLLILHLESAGWNPTILCGQAQAIGEPVDAELSSAIPPSLKMIKVGAVPERRAARIGIRDAGVRMYPSMRRMAVSVCRKRAIDAVYIPGPPWFMFHVGRLLKDAMEVPYAVDMLNADETAPGCGFDTGPLGRFLNRRVRQRIAQALSDADTVLGASKEIIRETASAFGADCADTVVLPTGLEPADYDRVRSLARVLPYWEQDHCFHAVHDGPVSARAFRTWVALLKAVQLLRKAGHQGIRRLRIHFMETGVPPGGEPSAIRTAADRLRVGDQVIEHGARLSYFDRLRVLCKADALIAAGAVDGTDRPDDLMPLLPAHIPILVLRHARSPWESVLKGAGITDRFDFADAEALKKAAPKLADLLIRAVERRLAAPKYMPAALQAYTAEAMTRRLAAALDSMAAKNRS